MNGINEDTSGKFGSSDDPTQIQFTGARRRKPSSAGFIDRAGLLERVLKGVNEKHSNGAPVRRAIRQAVQKWTGRTYRNGRPIRFSESTLARIYYRWLKAGKDRSALNLNYQGARSQVDQKAVLEFLAVSLTPGADSFSLVYRGMVESADVQPKDFSIPRFQNLLRSIPSPVRVALRDLHSAERNRSRAYRAAQRVLARRYG
jgi:hypothetical protein